MGPNVLSQKRASQGTKPIYGLTPCRNWILDKLERAITNAPENQEHLAAVRTETRDELAEERGFHEGFAGRTQRLCGRPVVHQLGMAGV